MKKHTLIIIALSIAVIFIGFVMREIVLNRDIEVTITQYEFGTTDEIKKISVDSLKDRTKINSFVDKLNPLSDNEMVNLVLGNEIVIKYGNNIEIGIQLGQVHYCYYTNYKKNITSLSYMPEGLYDWVVEQIK